MPNHDTEYDSNRIMSPEEQKEQQKRNQTMNAFMDRCIPATEFMPKLGAIPAPPDKFSEADALFEFMAWLGLQGLMPNPLNFNLPLDYLDIPRSEWDARERDRKAAE